MPEKKYYLICLFLLFSNNLLASEIEIGVSHSIPPYVIKDSDSGIEIDILRESFAIKGYTVKINYMQFKKSLVYFKKNLLDGIINVKDGVVPNAFYSKPVIAFQNCVYSLKKKNIPIHQNLDFLRNKSVIAFQYASVLLGKEFESIIKNNEEYEETHWQMGQLIRLFLDMNTDFVILDQRIFEYYKIICYKKIADMSNNPVTINYKFPPSVYVFAFKNRQIRDDFDFGLTAIIGNGDYDNILKRYLK